MAFTILTLFDIWLGQWRTAGRFEQTVRNSCQCLFLKYTCMNTIQYFLDKFEKRERHNNV